MKVKSSAFILSAVFILVMWTPKISMAINRIVVSNTSLCSGVTSPDVCYTSVQTAVTDAQAAATSDAIEIRPGTYSANVTLTKNIPIQGVETARTFLTGGGGTIITVSAVTNLMKISRLTFINAGVGIQVNSGSALNITNNVFEVGSSSTGIQISDNASTPLIMNNTFYQNGTAVSSTNQNNVSIVNNIFVGNSLAISANVALPGILNNLFFGNTTIGPAIMFTSTDPNYLDNVNTVDPSFVNATDTDINKRDFHLKKATPAGNTTAGPNSINNVSPPDMGAYGGSNSDTVPFPISDLFIIRPLGANSIPLRWSPNKCYLIGGYNVSYGSITGTYPTTNPNVSTTVSGNFLTYDLSGLSNTATAPTGQPSLTSAFANNALNLSWSVLGVSGATGYEVRYGTSPPPAIPVTPIDVGFQTSFTLSGLVNGTHYFVVVVPYAAATYYVAVKAFYGSDPSNSALQSVFSNEVNATLGASVYGIASNEIEDFPEAVIANPDLPNKGCFIATAAYGYYSAPQVQALREFRDRYLVTNAPGRAFVRWYYQYGPGGAQFINEHPWLKPVVRTALMPAVGGAMFMTRTSMFIKICVLAFICLLIAGSVWVYPRRKSVRPR